jgi:hypothetical protein
VPGIAPELLKLVSRTPLVVYRASANVAVEPVGLNDPAATILPLGWIATLLT